MTRQDVTGPAGLKALAIYLGAWSISTAYLALRGADWIFPILSLTVFAVTLGGLGWWLTRRMETRITPQSNAPSAAATMVGFIGVYGAILTLFGPGDLQAAIADPRAAAVAVLAYKLLLHVIAPAALLIWIGWPLRSILIGGGRQRGWWTTLIMISTLLFALSAIASPSLKRMNEVGLEGAMAVVWVLGAWAWVSLEAGLCEEFLFRVCLQGTLAERLKSPTMAIAFTALLFSLVHGPGLYLRGGPGTDGWSTDPVQVAAFTIAVLSPIAILFGVLWQRSRSLILVVLLHGAVDALPYTAEMASIWRS